MVEELSNVGAAAPSPLGGLQRGELWFQDGAGNFRQGDAKKPAQASGQLEWSLGKDRRVALCLGDPDKQVEGRAQYCPKLLGG